MDVLAGVRNERHLRSLRGLFARATVLPTGPADYHEAAALYRACRREGETVRKLVDCLIGSITIRAGAAVLHNDSDFDGWRGTPGCGSTPSIEPLTVPVEDGERTLAAAVGLSPLRGTHGDSHTPGDASPRFPPAHSCGREHDDIGCAVAHSESRPPFRQRHLRDDDSRLGEKCGLVLNIAVRHQLRVGPVVRNRLNWST